MTIQEKIEAMQRNLEESLTDWSAYGIETRDDEIESVSKTDDAITIVFKDGSRKVIR